MAPRPRIPVENVRLANKEELIDNKAVRHELQCCEDQLPRGSARKVTPHDDEVANASSPPQTRGLRRSRGRGSARHRRNERRPITGLFFAPLSPQKNTELDAVVEEMTADAPPSAADRLDDHHMHPASRLAFG